MKWFPFGLVILAGMSAASPILAQESEGRDFDAEIGRWSIQTRRLTNPLSPDADEWVTYSGEKVVTAFWGGQGNVAEVTEAGSTGSLHFLALRLYEPEARQWGLYFTSVGDGAISTPLHGQRRGDALEFTGPDTFRDRHILVRFIMREVDAEHARSEQYFSDDGGRTWELNWVNEYARVGD